MRVQVCMFTLYTRVYLCKHTLCACTCMCAHRYVYMCIYTHTHIHTHWRIHIVNNGNLYLIIRMMEYSLEFVFLFNSPHAPPSCNRSTNCSDLSVSFLVVSGFDGCPCVYLRITSGAFACRRALYPWPLTVAASWGPGLPSVRQRGELGTAAPVVCSGPGKSQNPSVQF